MLISSALTSLGLPQKGRVVPMRKQAQESALQPLKKDTVKFGAIAVGGVPLADDVETNVLADPFLLNLNFPINAQTTSQFNALLLDRADKKKEMGGHMKLLINTPGGEVYAGLQTAQLIKRLGVPVDTIIMGGQAASMGSLLFMSGTGRRIMTPDSTLMIHEPAIMGEIHANLTKMKNMVKDMQGMFRRMQRLFAEKTGLPMAKIEELTNTGEDLRVTPLQALKLGFATHVLMDDGKALTKASIQHLTDDEIQARDEDGDYSGLKTEAFDPKNVKKEVIDAIHQFKASQGQGGIPGGGRGRFPGGGNLKDLLGGGGLPPGFPGGGEGPGMNVAEKTAEDKRPKMVLFA